MSSLEPWWNMAAKSERNWHKRRHKIQAQDPSPQQRLPRLNTPMDRIMEPGPRRLMQIIHLAIPITRPATLITATLTTTGTRIIIGTALGTLGVIITHSITDTITTIFMMVMDTTGTDTTGTDTMDIAGRSMAIAVPQGMELGHPHHAARSTALSPVRAVLRGTTRLLVTVDMLVALWRLVAAHGWERWGDLQGVPAGWQCVRVDSPGIPVGLGAGMAVAVVDTAVVTASKRFPRSRQLSGQRRDVGLEV